MIRIHLSVEAHFYGYQTVQSFTDFPSNVYSLDVFASDFGPNYHLSIGIPLLRLRQTVQSLTDFPSWKMSAV